MTEQKQAQVRLTVGMVDTFQHTLDPKKRLTIPSEWRDALDAPEYVYVLPSAYEECLELWPVALMEKTLEKYTEADVFDSEADAEAQAIAEHAQMLKVDAAGRIRIGDALLDWAGISGAVTMIGGIRKAKLWASEKKNGTGGKIDISSFRAVAAKRAASAKAKEQT